MDGYDLRNLLNNDNQKSKSTANKRNYEDDDVPTKRFKDHHVPNDSKTLSSSPRSSSSRFKDHHVPNDYKTPSSSPRSSSSRNKITYPGKLNRITYETRQSFRRNIAAQRLDDFRKSLCENSSSSTSSSKKERHSFPENKYTNTKIYHSSSAASKKETSSSNKNLPSSPCSSGKSNRSSFANDRLNNLKSRLTTVQASVNISNNQSHSSSRSPQNSEYLEEMEWEQLPEERVIKDIVEVRNTAQDNPNIFNGIESSFCFHDNMDMVFNKSSVREKSKFIIIIDTNIFLSNLEVVQNLLYCNCNDNDITIVIPWMVFQELDFFKTPGSRLIKNAQVAVRFLNSELAKRNPKIKGQTAFEATENVITCRGPDDRILDCALQYKSEHNITIILSNDINLRNKAIVNNIESYSSDEILKVIAMKMKNIHIISAPVIDKDLEEKFRQFHKILSNILIKILEKEMFSAYGELWKRMVQFKTTWTAPTIIKCILKYWKSVFSFVYPKHIRPCISQLLQTFSDCEMSDPDLKHLIDSALAVCLHLQNVSEEYFQIILPIIKELKNLL